MWREQFGADASTSSAVTGRLSDKQNNNAERRTQGKSDNSKKVGIFKYRGPNMDRRGVPPPQIPSSLFVIHSISRDWVEGGRDALLRSILEILR